MKSVSEQWCIQIDVTNVCPIQCSNCTRMTAHVKDRPFTMALDTFHKAVESVMTFPSESELDVEGRTKVIGVMGGEPTLHPEFLEICEIMEQLIPQRKNRGLWTSLGPAYRRHEKRIKEVFGFQNKNPHKPPARHQPVFIASAELEPDKKKRYARIWDCWLQNSWCGSITPKGVFFCEVAGAMDVLFSGPGGLPIEPLWWNRSLTDFHDQVHRWCNRCGICMPLPGRMDNDRHDDVSPGNYAMLEACNSPVMDRCVVFDCAGYDVAQYGKGWDPRRYRDVSKGRTMRSAKTGA